MPNEADTCRTMITPKLQTAGWNTDPNVLAEQRLITHGRIIPVGQRYKRKAPKKADYLLCYRRDRVLAVVEAKASDNPAASGLQQAKDYAAMLDLKFAYATNGSEIIEFDYTTGLETRISTIPTPKALRQRHCAAPGPIDRKTLLTIPAFAAWWAENGKSTSSDAPPDAATIEAPSSATPDDQIDSAANLISAAVEADMLSRVRSVTSARFEQIVVDLLIAMGYGGGDPDMGKRLGRTGDGGIDGVIQQDALGLDAIYIQAKRYKDGSNIGPETIRGFIGSLAIARASKGVFVTSSKFTADAKKGAASTQHRIILIDGEELARLLVRHGVGVREDRTIVIKKLDEDYFADE